MMTYDVHVKTTTTIIRLLKKTLGPFCL